MSLRRFTTVEMILSKDIPQLVMWDAFLQYQIVLNFFHLVLFYPIIINNVVLILHCQSHVDT